MIGYFELSRKKFLAIVVLGLIVVFSLGIIDTPSYGLKDMGDWGDVNNSSVEIETEAYIQNPNPLELNISTFEADYAVKMNDVKLAEGGKTGLYIPEDENRTFSISTFLRPEKIPEWWKTHLENGEESRLEVPVGLQAEVFGFTPSFDSYTYSKKIETDLESKLDQAVSGVEGNYSREISVTGLTATETELEIVEASASWGELSENFTEIVADFKVKNSNSYPIPAPQMEGELNMNDVELAAWTANDVETIQAPEEGTIAPGETEDVKLGVKIDNRKIDDWFISHVRNDERTEARIDLRLLFDISGLEVTFPGGDGMNCGFSFQTAILEDGQNSSSEFQGCRYDTVSGTEESGDFDPGELENSTGELLDSSENDSDQNLSEPENLLPGL